MVVDIGRVFQLHAGWEAALPNIHPFYAVKCNEDRLLLKTLAALGTGFDCASKVSIITANLQCMPSECKGVWNPCGGVSRVCMCVWL